MIALGFAFEHMDGVTGVTCRRAGDCYALCLAEQAGRTSRERLGYLVRCFSEGMAFLPLHPAQKTTLGQAEEMAMNADLHRALAKVAGTGQLTLSLAPLRPLQNAPCTGQSWLRQKQCDQDRLVTDTAMFERLGEAVQCKASELRRSHHAQQCDLLIERQDEARAKAILAKVAANEPTLDNRTLSISGLWPPFAFANLAPPGSAT